MGDRRNEQSKRLAEYKKEYQRRPENKERVKERMRLYRARKKERLDAGNIVGTSVSNNDSSQIQKIHTETKTPALRQTNIDIDSQDDHQYELHQTLTVSKPQTSNSTNEQIIQNSVQRR